MSTDSASARKNRPMTNNVFYQGSVFTYPKLELKNIYESRKLGRSSGISLVSNGCPESSCKLANDAHLSADELHRVHETTESPSDSDLDALTIL